MGSVWVCAGFVWGRVNCYLPLHTRSSDTYAYGAQTFSRAELNTRHHLKGKGRITQPTASVQSVLLV